MTNESILKLLRAQSFRPFRINMTDGETYDVRHPEFAMPLKTNLLIGEPDSDGYHICALLRISSVEVLPETSGSSSSS